MRISDWSSDVCSSDLPKSYMSRGIATGLLALSVAAAIAISSPTAEAQSPKTVKFQMDFVPQGLYAGFFYAKAKGYYAAENLNVEQIDRASGREKVCQYV